MSVSLYVLIVSTLSLRRILLSPEVHYMKKGISNRKRHDSLDYTSACTTVILATTSEVHKLNNEQFTCTTHVHNRKCRTNSNKKLRPAAGPIDTAYIIYVSMPVYI